MPTPRPRKQVRTKRVRITKVQVERLTPPDRGQRFLRDTELKGFMARVTPGGAKSFCLEKRINGRNVRKMIGRYPDMTAEAARRVAHVWLGQLAEGKNPFREDDEKARNSLTLSKVLEDYLDARKGLKPLTITDYRQMVTKGLRPWRNRSLTEITKDMIRMRHRQLGDQHGPYYANSTFQLLRALFNYAIHAYDDSEGNPLLARNPVSILTQTRAWYPKKRRRTMITRQRLPAWYQAVCNLKQRLKDSKHTEKGLDPDAALVSDFLLLLLFSGLRRTEGTTLRFEGIDFDDRTMTIPNTKNGEPLTLPLSDYLYELLQRRAEITGGKGYVFPGPGKKGHLIEPKKHVQRVIEESGVTFILHDLRRTFITIAESLDLSHYAIKKLVNHKISGDVTAGYVVTNVGRLRAPMQLITDRILATVDPDRKSDTKNVASIEAARGPKETRITLLRSRGFPDAG